MASIEFNGKQYELPKAARFNEGVSNQHKAKLKCEVELYVLELKGVNHTAKMNLLYDRKSGKILGSLASYNEIAQIQGDDAGHLEAIVTHYINNRIIALYR